LYAAFFVIIIDTGYACYDAISLNPIGKYFNAPISFILFSIRCFRWSSGNPNSPFEVLKLKKELERLAQVNLDKATFTEKRDIINKLGIRVYPSED